jgi:glycosyltransferase involved in cell wall biosynthesis
MGEQQPFFSVLLPTRGRTHVVGWAIQSILSQTFRDLECVVIDNNIDDRIEKICAQFDDPRLRQVKTGGLNMPDNFDAAYLNARGVYAIVLEDRQCLYHHALQLTYDLAQGEDLQCLVWNYDLFQDGHTPARIRRNEGPRVLKRVRSDDVLEGVCGRDPKWDPLAFIHAHLCAVKVNLLEQIRADSGLKICEPTSPDNTAGLKFMNALDTYHYFSGSLSISHSDQLSNGANFHRNKSSVDEFWESIGGREKAYRYVPIKACFNENTAFNDYMRLADVLGGRLKRHAIDMVYYFTSLGSALLKAKEAGHDRSEELSAWRRALAEQPPEVRDAVKHNLSAQTKRQLLKQLRVRLGIRAIERMLRKKKTPTRRHEETTATVSDFVAAESNALAERDLALIPSLVRS